MKLKALFIYNIDPFHLLEINTNTKINEYLKANSVFFSGVLDGFQKNNIDVTIFHKPNYFLGYFTFKNVLIRSLINYLIGPFNRYFITKELIKIIKSRNINLIITNPVIFYGRTFLHFLSDNNIPSIQWFGLFPNSIKFNNKILLKNTPKYTLTCFSGDLNEKFPLKYKPKKFLKIHNPNITKPENHFSKTIEIIFIGGLQKKHSNRWYILETIYNFFGSKLEVYGYGKNEIPSNFKFKNIVKNPIFGEEYSNKIASSKIAINLYLDGYEDFVGINNRIFEVLSLNTLLITCYNEGIKEFFEIGKDLVVFKDSKHIIDLIDFYLNNDKERIAIQESGCNKSKKYNSVNFIKTLLENI